MGIWATLFQGLGYVPLNPLFPLDRTLDMIVRSKVRSIIVEPGLEENTLSLLKQIDEPMVALFPSSTVSSEQKTSLLPHTILDKEDVKPVASDATRHPSHGHDTAYVLFTSGSTGKSKGVQVSQANVMHFLNSMSERYAIKPEDRFSQTFDLTFDLSVFDMFMAWKHGACLCVPTAEQKALPKKWINDEAITVWFSVPSTLSLMKQFRMLKPGTYPNIRLGLFCGEALPTALVQDFALACPNARLENLYGPTELTIACTLHAYDPSETVHPVMPIGKPYPEMAVVLLDENGNESPLEGELCMTGPQTAKGYLDDHEKTAAAFITRYDGQTWYKTGDRVKWMEGVLHYLGRMDHQIKIQGYRVELGEIESVARNITGQNIVIAVPYKTTADAPSYDSIALVFADFQVDEANIHTQCEALLPPYMRPRKIICINAYPLNANGKIDRNALQLMVSS